VGKWPESLWLAVVLLTAHLVFPLGIVLVGALFPASTDRVRTPATVLPDDIPAVIAIDVLFFTHLAYAIGLLALQRRFRPKVITRERDSFSVASKFPRGGPHHLAHDQP
jgi:hypothetical protein